MCLLSLLTAPADTGRSYQVVVGKTESLWVTEAGQGQPVVLIPGLFGSAYSFRRVIPLLAANGFRAIVIEPLGIGFSARPEKANYSLTSQADRIALVLELIDARGVVVVGHSVGASVAYRLAYRWPALVRAVLSLEGGPAESVMTPGARAAMRFIPWVKWFGGMKLIRSRIRKGLRETASDTSWVTEEVVEGYTAGSARDIDQTLKSMLAMASSKEPEKLKPRLAEIRVPVLLLVGGAFKGGGAPRSEIELLHASLVSFDVDTVPGSGFYIQEERPGAVVEGVQKVLGATAQAVR